MYVSAKGFLDQFRIRQQERALHSSQLKPSRDGFIALDGMQSLVGLSLLQSDYLLCCLFYRYIVWCPLHALQMLHYLITGGYETKRHEANTP